MTTTTNDFDADARVQRGVALLDRKAKVRLAPRFWRRQVDRDTLDLASVFDCVLGQVYGNFGVGLDTLGLGTGNDEAAADHGFADHGGTDEEYAALHAAWLGVLSNGSAL